MTTARFFFNLFSFFSLFFFLVFFVSFFWRPQRPKIVTTACGHGPLPSSAPSAPSAPSPPSAPSAPSALSAPSAPSGFVLGQRKQDDVNSLIYKVFHAVEKRTYNYRQTRSSPEADSVTKTRWSQRLSVTKFVVTEGGCDHIQFLKNIEKNSCDQNPWSQEGGCDQIRGHRAGL